MIVYMGICGWDLAIAYLLLNPTYIYKWEIVYPYTKSHLYIWVGNSVLPMLNAAYNGQENVIIYTSSQRFEFYSKSIRGK